MIPTLRLWTLSLLVVALLAAAPDGALAQAGSESRYLNATFDFSVRLDAGQLPHYQTVTSPDGITLTSPEGGAVINIFGAWNDAERSLAGLVDQFKHDLAEAEFTYEWLGRRSAVLSGYQAGDIFYVRIAMSRDGARVAVLDMIYAPELKGELDPVVERLSTSLEIR